MAAVACGDPTVRTSRSNTPFFIVHAKALSQLRPRQPPILRRHVVRAAPIHVSSVGARATSAVQGEVARAVPVEYHARTGINSRADYETLYNRSIQDPAGFWADLARQFHWEKPWRKDHMSFNFDRRKGQVSTTFFDGARTNICYNAVDRHIEQGRGSQPCFLWEGNDIGEDRVMTFSDVRDEVSRVANWLKSVGIGKGDSVAIYMPMVCELPIAMLACARIGAVHSVVFGGFSAESLSQRIADAKSKVVITASGGARAKKVVPLKQIADKAVQLAAGSGFQVENVLVYEHKSVPKGECAWTEGRDTWYQDAIPQQDRHCPVEWVDSEHPLFLLYTSGSTGNPKGVVHSTGGYMVSAATTTRYIFDLQPGDVYWCTADCGWITGHSYLAYGPLLCGAQSVIFEGVPNYPTPARCWQVVEKYKVRQFYTAPTLVRSLEAQDNKFVTQHDRSSLRILGTVGEPINPRAWMWFFETVGEGRCPIVDTWWQTETGAAMITPLPGAWPCLPGSATLPFFGVLPVILDDKGKELDGEAEGILGMKQAWPSTIRTVKGDHKRFEETYFSAFPGYYFTGDGCKRSADGQYTITGRVDDVINVSGHRVGTAEVEAALASHGACIEAAVVGFDHDIKGQGIYAYVTLHDGNDFSEDIRKDLVKTVREQIGAFAAPDVIHWAPGLPKTRSGKIMRRILRKIAVKKDDELGDTSTLADPGIVQGIIELRGK
ncbi:g1309 [Coccomyxa viridis]|uniref:Acetyl-coenzyme A synthetase n=1 Tax=Coccomyxa viridis TaxID=1274662 RepID=A0ABP1FHQ7_9CHLO